MPEEQAAPDPEPAPANGTAADPQPAPQQAPPPRQPQQQPVNQTNVAIMQLVEMAKNDDLIGCGIIALGKQGQILQMTSSDKAPITDAVLYTYLSKAAANVQKAINQREEEEAKLAELDRARQARQRQREAEMEAARQAVQQANPVS